MVQIHRFEQTPHNPTIHQSTVSKIVLISLSTTINNKVISNAVLFSIGRVFKLRSVNLI